MRPDDIVVETFHNLALGKATKDDVRAAIQLALEQPGWEGRDKDRENLMHLMSCEQCLFDRMMQIRTSWPIAVRILAETGFDNTPIPKDMVVH